MGIFLFQHCYLGAFFRRYKRTMRLIKLAAISMQKEIHWLSLIFCRWNDKETNQWMRSNPLLIQMNHILNSVLDPLVLDITYIIHTSKPCASNDTWEWRWKSIMLLTVSWIPLESEETYYLIIRELSLEYVIKHIKSNTWERERERERERGSGGCSEIMFYR